MHIEFDSLTNAAGLEILDLIETRRFTFLTDGVVHPTAATTEGFAFPVDTACTIETERFELPYTVPVDVRTPDGTHLDSISPPATTEFADSDYLVELHAPMKLYFRVDAPLSVDADTDAVRFDFGRETEVRIGARSYHSAPAETVTVPDDPEALMEAVSTFSSALKTTSPERAWPTLRGHPPRIERGDELRIPEGLDPPDTGITIAVPPEYGPVYAVAPLAYYLGAEVRPGETPRLKAEAGVARYLGDDATEISESVADVLKRVFVLDCITRTEGYYPVDLHEREELESRVDLDFAALYEAPPGERLAAYLAVPDDAVEAVTPTWHRVTHMRPDAEAAELLPYIVNDLSLVRVEPYPDSTWTPTESQRQTEEAIGSFVRTGAGSAPGPRSGPDRESRPGPASVPSDDFVRSVGPTVRSPNDGDGTETPGEGGTETPGEDDFVRGVPDAGEYVSLPEVDALEQAWVGEGTPDRGAKLLAEAFRNESPTPTDGVVEITVVCNDDRMREEWDSVAEIYGTRDEVPVAADYHAGVETDDLRALLAEDSDVFHFIGHIDGRGFECPDGVLDAETVADTGATVALLNGCRSHDQGIELVRAGANAAIVSLSDVSNCGAAEVGETLARLLKHGFGIESAMQIAREYTSIGRDYVVIGDPGVAVTQRDSGVPILYHVEQTSTGGEINIEAYSYPTRSHSMGSNLRSYFPGIDLYHLAIGLCGTTTMAANVFTDTVSEDSIPIVNECELVWSKAWFSDTELS